MISKKKVTALALAGLFVTPVLKSITTKFEAATVFDSR